MRDDRRAALEPWRHFLHHGIHDLGDSGHHEDIVDLEAGRLRDWIGDEDRPLWRARHAQARFIRLTPDRLEMREQDLDGFRMMVDLDAEGLGHRIAGYVVMRWADAAGGEDIGVAPSQRNDGIVEVVLGNWND